MEELKSLIQQVDDDYLVGLSNKGTVKRAYKDMEQEQPEVAWQGNEVQVSLKEETVIIRAPLGESGCSCPSRSICRHVVTAVLWLKKLQAEAGEPQADGGEMSGEIPTDGKILSGVTPGSEEEPMEEILRIPLPKLKRACGAARFRTLLSRIRAGELPSLEESSIVAVPLPWEKATVKLLEPFAYSTCSCHSQELCAHKAQAVLIYQLHKKKLTLKELEASQEEEKVWDTEQVCTVCVRVKEVICHQVSTGLSRHFQEAPDELERLAVLTHRAGLPQLESWLREAASMYGQYASRSAAFRSDELLKRLLRLYTRADRLLQAESQAQIQALAGTFRDTYEWSGNLDLMGIGAREFHSKTGYEGEIYYFLEKEQGEWYTWTDARPVFYEKTRRRSAPSMKNASAPWGLPCSREELLRLEFSLKNAKAASGHRLSASQDTKGEIVGSRDLSSGAFQDKMIWDYERLARQYFALRQEQERREYPALVGVVRFGETSFDKVSQRFSWSLYDWMGRTLFISLRYTKEEQMTIRLLERLEQRLRKQELGSMAFFGFLYLDEEGRLCLYPVEFFQTEMKRKMEIPAEMEDFSKEQKKLPEPDVWKSLEQYHRESAGQLNDLFVSGIYSVQDALSERLAELSEDGERLGLLQAGSALGGISRLLQEKRHRMEFEPEPVVEMMAGLCRYLDICREKLEFDKVLLTMREERQDEPE